MSYLKLVKDKISNYEKQLSRMKIQMKTGKSKAGKKGIFRGSVQRLVRAGGGNISSLACHGETDSAGAERRTNITTLLWGCEGDIGTYCGVVSILQTDQRKAEG